MKNSDAQVWSQNNSGKSFTSPWAHFSSCLSKYAWPTAHGTRWCACRSHVVCPSDDQQGLSLAQNTMFFFLWSEGSKNLTSGLYTVLMMCSANKCLRIQLWQLYDFCMMYITCMYYCTIMMHSVKSTENKMLKRMK